jgi:hypothetical protein
VTVDLTKLKGAVKAWWFDPRDGSARPAGEMKYEGTREFSPPACHGRRGRERLGARARRRLEELPGPRLAG